MSWKEAQIYPSHFVSHGYQVIPCCSYSIQLQFTILERRHNISVTGPLVFWRGLIWPPFKKKKSMKNDKTTLILRLIFYLLSFLWDRDRPMRETQRQTWNYHSHPQGTTSSLEWSCHNFTLIWLLTCFTTLRDWQVVFRRTQSFTKAAEYWLN